MKIILTQQVRSLGKRGDVKEVSDGYARNFLIPKGLAAPATPQAVQEVERKKKKEARIAEVDLIKTEELANNLDGKAFEISAKINEDGTLYAAISPAKIAAVIKKNGHSIAADNVIINEPLKEVGEHEVTVSLNHGLEARVTIIIHGEN